MGCKVSKTIDRPNEGPYEKHNSKNKKHITTIASASTTPETSAETAFAALDATFGSYPNIHSSPSSTTSKSRRKSVSLYDTAAFDNEAARIDALQNCAILDTDVEGRFDGITQLAGNLFDTPVAIVTLVDKERGWFKSLYGPFGNCVTREGSFCSYITVPTRVEVLIVEDCTKDARFSDNPFVKGPPHLRFYAGCPLVTSEGHRLGTVCLCDFRPRYLPATAYNVMCNLAEIVIREIERDIVQKKLDSGCNNEEIGGKGFEEDGQFCWRQKLPAAYEPVVMLNTYTSSLWDVIYANPSWLQMLAEHGADSAELDFDFLNHKRRFWDVFAPVSPEFDPETIKQRVKNGEPAYVIVSIKNSASIPSPTYRIQFWLASRDQLRNSIPIYIPSFVAPDERSALEGPPSGRSGDMPLGSLYIATAQLITSGGVGKNTINNIAISTDGSATNSSSNKTRLATFSPRSILTGLAPRKPRQLADLKLGPLLGQGSYGRVYRGELRNKTVAIKVLEIPDEMAGGRFSTGDDSSDLDGFNSGSQNRSTRSTTGEQAFIEAVLSRHLAHPNIVPTLDFIMINPSQQQQKSRSSADLQLASLSMGSSRQIWIVQHLCDKGTLYDSLDRGYLREELSLDAPPSFPVVLATALDIASALKYLHDQNDIIHGDLSGNNVMLSTADNDRGFVAIVADFGLSRVLSAELTQTQTVGTVTHMPPELLIDGFLSKAADAWAFGVLLFEMWTSKRAWAGMSYGNIIFQVTVRQKTFEMPQDCPQGLRQLAAECMERDYKRRPTFAEIVERLEKLKNTR